MPSGFSAIPEFYSGIKKDKAFYVLDVDHENKVVTLSFAQECFVANNLNELKVWADITGQLNQDLNTLLQSGLQDDKGVS